MRMQGVNAPVSEGAGTHKTLSRGAKAAARGGYDVTPLQDLSKDVPGGLAREAHPHIGRILAAID